MLQEAIKWLREQCRDSFSLPAIYVPATGEEYAFNVVPGRSVFEAPDEYGIITETETQDFLVSVEEMPKEPQKGDVLLYNGCRYEVLAIQGKPCWRWSDPYQLMRRIHTKATGEL